MNKDGRLVDAGVSKIWIAIGTPFQVNFFHVLMERLRGKFEFLITARNHDRTIAMLEAKGIEHYRVGYHGGKQLGNKLLAYAETTKQMIPIIKKEKPDLLITERWPEAVRTSFGFGIPAWTIFYDEREFHANWLTFPLSSKVFAPTFYTMSDLRRHGITGTNKVVWFRGFHANYLKDEVARRVLGLDTVSVPSVGKAQTPTVLVRPEPDFAVFYQGKHGLLEKVVKILVEELKLDVLVIPRSTRQAKRFPRDVVLPMEAAISTCPVTIGSMTLGAAETMLMESFVCGIPAISAIYWQPSRPVEELHKYVPHSTDVDTLVEHVERFIDEKHRASFSRTAHSIVDKMDNPVDIIARELQAYTNR